MTEQKRELLIKLLSGLPKKNGQQDIAIIGVSGRFPGAPTIDVFWENLKAGRSSITEVPPERWNWVDYYDPGKNVGKTYSKWGGFIEDVDKFDPLFFNISPAETEGLDPQERLFLEVVWHTLEDAGYTPDSLINRNNKVGVFVGVMNCMYEWIGGEAWGKGMLTSAHTSYWSYANLASYFFNWQGPSIAIDTACSSSLTAVHLACESLKKNECHTAIAGGVNLILHPKHYLRLAAMNMIADDGRCKSFGKGANGYVPGEGVGAVLLKPLAQAIMDNDQIYAVIKASSVNSGGKTGGFTVPNPVAQSELILEAIQKAKIHPETISYIEAHGTGTSLGDPIEINGLTRAFSHYTDKKQFCAIGSAKSNIGHLESAAGIAGLTKVLLMLKNKTLVPSISSEETNPGIHFEETPFYLQHQLTEWKRPMLFKKGIERECLRRAGLSSFGAGGANVHLILEEYDSVNPEPVNQETKNLFVFSARNQRQLEEYLKIFIAFLMRNDRECDSITLSGNRESEQEICAIFAEMLNVSLNDIGIEEEFDGYGLDQVALNQLAGKLRERYALQLTAIDFLQYNTIKKLAEFMRQSLPIDHGRAFETTSKYSGTEIAFTLQTGRKAFQERLAVIAVNSEELMEKLRQYLETHRPIPDIFTGSYKKSHDHREIFPSDNLVEIAAAWVQGERIDWMSLYPENKPIKVSLPGYCFEKKRYWVPVSGEAGPQKTVSALHPLVGKNISTLEEQCFSSTFTGTEFIFADHVIRREKILPGTAYIEMACAAGNLSLRNREIKTIKKVLWLSPITGNAEKEIFTALHQSVDVVSFNVFTVDDGERTVHATGILETGRVGPVFKEKVDIAVIRERCTQIVDSQVIYDRFAERGFKYGPQFRTIRQLYSNEQESLALLELNGEEEQDFILHPGLLDGALQSTIGLIRQDKTDDNTVVLPFSIDELIIHGKLPSSCYAYVKYAAGFKPNHQGTMLKFDISLFTTNGALIAEIKNFTLREWKKDYITEVMADARETNLHLYQSTWKEKSTVDSPVEDYGNVLVISGEKEFYDCLLKKIDSKQGVYYHIQPGKEFQLAGNSAFRINVNSQSEWELIFNTITDITKKPLNIFYFLPLEFAYNVTDPMLALETAVYPIFQLSKALLAQKIRDVNLIYCYQAFSPYFAAFNGFARTISQENPALHYKTIGLKDVTAAVEVIVHTAIHELTTYNLPDQEVYSDITGRYIREARPVMVHQGKSIFKDDGIYLITGGAGGLGLIFAKHIAGRYRASLILTGRSELSAEKELKIAELKRMAKDVLYLPSDISNPDDVQRLLKEIKNRYGRLDGILHSAGITRDGFLFKKNFHDFQAVLQPKVLGTVYLDEATQNEQLDFFILFSSVSGILGNIGQSDYAYANSFLDFFAEQRQNMVAQNKRSGKTLAINWGLWAEGGMDVDRDTALLMKNKFGIVPIQPDDALAVLDSLIGMETASVTIIAGMKERIDTMFRIDNRPSSSKPLLGEEVKDDISAGVVAMLVQICSKLLKVDQVELDTQVNLSEYGVDSIMMMKILNQIEETYGMTVEPNAIAEHQTIAALAEHLIDEGIYSPVNDPIDESPVKKEIQEHGQNSRFIVPVKLELKKDPTDGRIAVISIAGRMPGSNTVEEFWENLKSGKNLIREVPENRWSVDQYYSPDKGAKNKSYTKWAGFIDNIDLFDADFFQVKDIDAQVMDPQHRILLELSQELIDRAGYAREEFSGTATSIWIGATQGSYSSDFFPLVDEEGMKHILVNSIPNMMAARISDFYNLRGPSQVIDTACSSSLVAIHQACQDIIHGGSEMAIAGGIELLLNPHLHIGFSKAEVLSDEDKSYIFDRRAKGFVLGEGAGLVLLKSYQKALADGDQIIGVILASAVNNDGHTIGLTVPDISGQKAVIKMAIEKSGISPESVTCFEAHGTGTLLGDPIEIRAATEIYHEYTEKKHYCATGSVKSNIGHLIHAAGVASFIKVILAMQAGMIPPTLHCETPHPRFKFETSPFYPITALQKWEPECGLRRGAISSFGFGGTNCHLLLEEFVPAKVASYTQVRRPFQPTIFKRKRYWIGREIGRETNEQLELIRSLANGEISIAEAAAMLLKG